MNDHIHEWQSLGFVSEPFIQVVQACSCGDARYVSAERGYTTRQAERQREIEAEREARNAKYNPRKRGTVVAS